MTRSKLVACFAITLLLGLWVAGRTLPLSSDSPDSNSSVANSTGEPDRSRSDGTTDPGSGNSPLASDQAAAAETRSASRETGTSSDSTSSDSTSSDSTTSTGEAANGELTRPADELHAGAGDAVSDSTWNTINKEFARMKNLKLQMPQPDTALPGRDEEVPVPDKHFVNSHPIQGEFDGLQRAIFGMGCFWGAERLFWTTPGVFTTAVGYAGGYTKNPNYEEVCSGGTGHAEVVLIVFDPDVVTYEQLLHVFWENHDPTQGMRQGNDVGTQYRSAIYAVDDEQLEIARRSRAMYQQALAAAGLGEITTEVDRAPKFFYAEPYHQQYLGKKPWGYCGLAGTGVTCPVGLGVPSVLDTQ